MLVTARVRETPKLAPPPVSEAIRPEYFRLPEAGKHDPFFGLPRSKFYELEATGAIRLTRLIPRGKTRGTTLVPFYQMRDYLRSLEVEAR